MKKVITYTSDEVKNIIQTAQWIQTSHILRIIDKYLSGPYANEHMEVIRKIKRDIENL